METDVLLLCVFSFDFLVFFNDCSSLAFLTWNMEISPFCDLDLQNHYVDYLKLDIFSSSM